MTKKREYGAGKAPSLGTKMGDLIQLQAVRDKLASEAAAKDESVVEPVPVPEQKPEPEIEEASGFRPAAEVLGAGNDDETRDEEREASEDLGTARTQISTPPPAEKPKSVEIEVPSDPNTGEIPLVVLTGLAGISKGMVDPPKSVMLSKSMDLEAASLEARANLARKKREEQPTMDVPIVPPDSLPKVRKGMEAKQIPAATPARLFWEKHKNTIGLVVMGIIILTPLISFGSYEALRAWNRSTSVSVPTEVAETPAPVVTVVAPDAAVAPEPVAPVVALPEPPLPPGPPSIVIQPGLRGRRGTRVVMLASEAFPVDCLTGWSTRRTDDARYICAPGKRNGDNVCDCNVVGIVP